MQQIIETIWRETGLEGSNPYPPRDMDQLLIMARRDLLDRDACWDEDQFEKAQDELREELGNEHDEQIKGMQEQIDDLEAKLKEAEDEAHDFAQQAAEFDAELADVKGLAKAQMESSAQYIKTLEEQNRQLQDALKDALFSNVED